MKNILLLVLLFSVFQSATAQIVTNNAKLQQLSSEYYQKSSDQRIAVEEFARVNNIPIRVETDSTLMEIMEIDENGNPQYYIIHNENAAKTISTDNVYSGGGAGLSLSGSGVTIHEWDGGTVLSTHQEFDTRVTNGDVTATHYHATHVAGTIMASGVQSAAKGMAYAASLEAYDWTDDESEMATAAAAGALVSNHSYGTGRGWVWNGSSWVWYGDTGVSTQEDYLFGFYNSWAEDWDEIAYNAPYYLIVKSAGNDRGNGPSGGTYPQDGPYDCIGPKGIAKNVLTVGAVNDITGGWTQASDVVMSSFSSWGPVDDGRIKPDIVANGISLYSTDDDANNDYTSLSGTSMSSPSVTGSIGLLIQHYENVVGSGSKMKASTAKALVIHTADEAGTNTGPDYEFGWGLMNTQSAAAKITEDQTTDVVLEYYLSDGDTYTRNITTTGTNPIKVTVVWTDPAGTPPTASLDPADVMLVNDLDVRVTQASNTYYAWKLDKDNPSNAATQAAENDVDNVEVVYIASPTSATTYTITVDHDGTLSGGGQAFSMIISGDIDNAVAPVADFYADNTAPVVNAVVDFFDVSANIPTSWLWSFSPATVTYVSSTSATSQNPVVEFTAAGSYEVSLYTENANGNDTETKTGYITVSASASYCSANSTGGYGYISRVQLGTIDNSSVYSGGGYGDYTAQSTDLTISSTTSITITNAYVNSVLDLGIWVDWNQDGDFSDTSEEVVCELNGGGDGTHSINVPSDASLGSTRMRIRTFANPTSCSSCGSTSNGEVEDYSVNIVASSVTWTGSSSTDWATAGNWSGSAVPTESNSITIPTTPSGGVFPAIGSGTSDAKCNNLTIESGASLSISGHLAVDGTLTNSAGNTGIVIESTSSGTGSLITDSDGISATVERYLTGGKWHLIGAPVSSATANFLYFSGSPDVWLKAYNENDDTWTIVTDVNTSMPMGKGFATWVETGNNVTSSFTGATKATDLTLTTATTPPLAYTDASHGYNLVANPYPCALDWDQGGWTRTNIDGTTYVWEDGSNYLTRNSNGQGSLTNGIIPCGQGFFVRTTGASPTLTIPKLARTYSSQAYHNPAGMDYEGPPYAVIDVNNNDKNDETWITFSEDFTEEYDYGWDALKLFGDGTAPQLYSYQNDLELSIVALPEIGDDGSLVSLFFKARVPGEHIISLKDQKFLSDVDILLEDLILDEIQDMHQNPAYIFSASTQDDPNRFLVHFNPAVTVIDDDQNQKSVRIYSWNKDIYVRSVENGFVMQNTRIQIFDLYGRQIVDREVNQSTLVKIPVNVSNSYLVVKVVSDKRSVVKKVFVQ